MSSNYRCTYKLKVAQTRYSILDAKQLTGYTLNFILHAMATSLT